MTVLSLPLAGSSFALSFHALRLLTTFQSHVFCTHCADSTGLSSSTSAQRTCSACSASLHNPDDVVIAGLNPSEDYKTSVLSGLSPTLIMECASRGLAFHSYQTSQEIVYQEHLAKGLTEKYNTLSQQMDQVIHDANSQIKVLEAKMQGIIILLLSLDFTPDISSHASRASISRRQEPRTL